MSNRIEVAYEAGAASARGDIAAGQPRLRYGARGSWGLDLAESLLSRFGVELVVLSCLVTDESLSFDDGYNAVVEDHIDGIWGAGSVKAVHTEVQRRRKEAYDAWVESEALRSSSKPSNS